MVGFNYRFFYGDERGAVADNEQKEKTEEKEEIRGKYY